MFLVFRSVKKETKMSKFKEFLFHYIVLNVLLAVGSNFIIGMSGDVPLIPGAICLAFMAVWYLLFSRKGALSSFIHNFYMILTRAVFITFTALMFMNGGMMDSSPFLLLLAPLFPFIPMIILLAFIRKLAVMLIGIILVGHVLIITFLRRKEISPAAVAIPLAAVVISTALSAYSYSVRDEIKYGGHGFKYMHGYSSTDFTGYYVHSDPTKLVTLDHEPRIVITGQDNMPILDGAEACYPVYSAVAKAIYKDIALIEREFGSPESNWANGKIVTFTNTVHGFYRLADGEVDMLFGARPSQEQLEYAREQHSVEIRQTQIGREAFVFFVEADNPVDSLTSEQIRAIYHGDITNWKEVGGKDEKIVAFQRPRDSGSQTMMIYFMGDVSLKEPKTYEVMNPMEGIVKEVANYHNEDGAMGYTFRYFLEGLMQEKGVKMLAVDGVYPTVENIKNGSYPLVVGLYCLTREGDTNPNVQKVLDFLLSEDGQYIIEQTGYAPLK